MEGRGAQGLLRFVAFDCLYARGQLLLDKPLEHRRKALRETFRRLRSPRVRVIDEFPGTQGTALFKEAARLGLEGVVGKRLGSRYLPGVRTREWVKIPFRLRDDFVVVGYFPRSGGGIGSLIVADRDGGGSLIYAGVVGASVSARLQKNLNDALRRSHRKRCSLKEAPIIRDHFGELPRDVNSQWVAPRLVVEVEYRQRTRDGLRHAVLKGFKS